MQIRIIFIAGFVTKSPALKARKSYIFLFKAAAGGQAIPDLSMESYQQESPLTEDNFQRQFSQGYYCH